MIRTALFAAVVSLVAVAGAQDKIKVPAPSKDAYTAAFEMTVSVQGMDAKVHGNLKFEQSVDNSILKVISDFSDIKVEVGGSEVPVPTSTLELSVKTDGEVTAAKGGLEGADMARTALLMWFVPPTGEIAKGESYSREFKASGDVPARKVENRFEGAETVDGKTLWKFTQKLTEPGNGGLTSDSTFWLDESGKLVRLESKFENLPIPQAGDVVSGRLTLVRK